MRLPTTRKTRRDNHIPGVTNSTRKPPESRLEHLDRDGVDPILEFGIERFHHGAMAREASLALERGAGDADAEVRFAALAPTGMTVVRSTFIDHFKMGRVEFF